MYLIVIYPGENYQLTANPAQAIQDAKQKGARDAYVVVSNATPATLRNYEAGKRDRSLK